MESICFNISAYPVLTDRVCATPIFIEGFLLNPAFPVEKTLNRYSSVPGDYRYLVKSPMPTAGDARWNRYDRDVRRYRISKETVKQRFQKEVADNPRYPSICRELHYFDRPFCPATILRGDDTRYFAVVDVDRRRVRPYFVP